LQRDTDQLMNVLRRQLLVAIVLLSHFESSFVKD
jgi:hypothetical protein